MLGISLRAVVMMPQDPAIFGIPIDFILFDLTLVCVALLHQHTMGVALAALLTVVILPNLLCLLLRFAVLYRHFEKSHVPLVLPKYLPHDWKDDFALLGLVWVLSSFLDNIAGALIDAALANQVSNLPRRHKYMINELFLLRRSTTTAASG